MAYLTLTEFKLYSLMPSTFVDEIEAVEPGFTEAQLELVSGMIDARLRKRYGTNGPNYSVPFTAPYPLVVRMWTAQITTMNLWLRRGYSPTDQEAEAYTAQYQQALADLKEAANSMTGLFDLPVAADSNATGLGNVGRAYSEQSPYVWTTKQRNTGRNEDSNGNGSTI